MLAERFDLFERELLLAIQLFIHIIDVYVQQFGDFFLLNAVSHAISLES